MGCLDRDMARAAVAGGVWKIKLIARSIIRLGWIRAEWERSIIAVVPEACARALIAIYICTVVHGKEAGIDS